MNRGLEFLCCYSDQDQSLYQELRQQLSPFERQGLISTWSNADITAGTNWQEEVEKHLNTAEIILLLISPGFISSDYCYSQQLMRAMERHKSGGARVIPVLLRPVHWEDAPFSELQVTPKNKKFVTTWRDSHEAFYEIVEDISWAIEEIIQKKQSRMRSLFGYETGGGERSDLWDNPAASSFDRKKFHAWCNRKRDLKREEIVDQTWLKITFPEYVVKVQLLENGELRECLISDPTNTWTGYWKLHDGVLRLNIGAYEDDIFANNEGIMHSGIEFKEGQDNPWAYLALLTYQTGGAKHLPLHELPGLIHRIFDQVLGREANQRELIMYGSVLGRGELSVRDMVKLLGLSHDHMALLADIPSSDALLELCYKQFLGREIDTDGRRYYLDQIKDRGVNWVINHLINSPEYNRVYDIDKVPHKS